MHRDGRGGAEMLGGQAVASELALPARGAARPAPVERRSAGAVARRWAVRPALLARLLVAAALLGVVVLHEPAYQSAYRTREAAAPWLFSLLDWEVREVAARQPELLQALRGERPPADAAERALVQAYFATPRAARAEQRPAAERAIQRLVADAWLAEGLGSELMLAGPKTDLFPPVSFQFTDPPQVLIVSPRDRIEVREYVLLEPSLPNAELERLEEGVARRGLATLVTPIGGLATYPAMVLESGSAESTLAAVAHEWVHAWLFFQPLGRGYWSSQAMRTINETAAELAGAELGQRLAAELELPGAHRPAPRPQRPSELDRLIRETRQEVDQLLAAGQVAAAEALMERRRLELNERGYQLRRLNQAWFAFYGSYAEGPAGTGPIPGLVRNLRQRSASLGEFLEAIGKVDSPAALRALAGEA